MPVDTESQAQEIMDSLYELTGNSGQNSILDEASDSFIDWAVEALESGKPPNDAQMRTALNLTDQKWDATDLIWDEGFQQVEESWAENWDSEFEGDGTGDGGRGSRGRSHDRDRSSRRAQRAGRAVRQATRGGAGQTAQEKAMHARLRELGRHR